MAVSRDGSKPAPDGILSWLLEQVIRLPDTAVIGGHTKWTLDEMRKRLGRVPVAWLSGVLFRRVEMEASAVDSGDECVRTNAQLSRYVARVTGANAADPDVRQALDTIVDLVFSHSSVAHHVPEMLQKVDPDGLAVPDMVSLKVRAASTSEQLLALARIAGAHVLRTAVWRALAKPMLACAARLPPEERRFLYSNLVLDKPSAGTWEGLTNAVRSELQLARNALDTENDADFRPFWEWHIERAEAKLQSQEEWAKEYSSE